MSYSKFFMLVVAACAITGTAGIVGVFVATSVVATKIATIVACLSGFGLAVGHLGHKLAAEAGE